MGSSHGYLAQLLLEVFPLPSTSSMNCTTCTSLSLDGCAGVAMIGWVNPASIPGSVTVVTITSLKMLQMVDFAVLKPLPVYILEHISSFNKPTKQSLQCSWHWQLLHCKLNPSCGSCRSCKSCIFRSHIWFGGRVRLLFFDQDHTMATGFFCCG